MEVGHSARNKADHQRLMFLLRAGAQWSRQTTAVEDRAIEVQEALSARNHHRAAKQADLLIAATAEAYGLTVLHYDRDFELIASITGQPCVWVAAAGSI